MDRVDEQDADLLPLLLNEANWRGGCHDSGIERRLYCRPAARLRGKIEPDDVLIALQRLYISHRKIARPLSGAPPLPRRINFADLKSRKVALLGGLEGCPLLWQDLRRPFDCLDRRKAFQQISGPRCRKSVRDRTCRPTERSLQLLEK